MATFLFVVICTYVNILTFGNLDVDILTASGLDVDSLTFGNLDVEKNVVLPSQGDQIGRFFAESVVYICITEGSLLKMDEISNNFGLLFHG
jgi:hypothetical protein